MDLSKLVVSKNIEDKLKAAENLECSSQDLEKIIMDESITWGSEIANSMVDAIVLHPNCPPRHLKTIYNHPFNDGQRKLILQNPACPQDILMDVMENGTIELKEYALKSKGVSKELILNLVKYEPIGSKLIKSVSERDDLDKDAVEILDLKSQLLELKNENRDSNNYSNLLESLLSVTDWGRNIFEALYKDIDPDIRAAVAKNPSLPEDLLLKIITECKTIYEKVSALSNPSCPTELLIKESVNLSSSRIRKAVALNPQTPQNIIDKLLEDEYKWVVEAAATNSNKSKKELDKIIASFDGMSHSYEISSSGVTVVEDVGGGVSIDEVVQAILSGAESWEDYVSWGDANWYDFDSGWHEYGPVDVVDTIKLPDETMSINPEIECNEPIDIYDTDLTGKPNPCGDSFLHIAKSWEYGSWIYSEFELENEFNPNFLKANMWDGIISSYTYDNPQNNDSVDIEGELDKTETSSTDIGFYVDTSNGLEECDDFETMREEMKEKKLNPEEEADVLKYLEDYIARKNK